MLLLPPGPWPPRAPRTNHSPARKAFSWPSREAQPTGIYYNAMRAPVPYKPFSILNITPAYKILPFSQLRLFITQQPAPTHPFRLAVSALLTFSFQWCLQWGSLKNFANSAPTNYVHIPWRVDTGNWTPSRIRVTVPAPLKTFLLDQTAEPNTREAQSKGGCGQKAQEQDGQRGNQRRARPRRCERDVWAGSPGRGRARPCRGGSPAGRGPGEGGWVSRGSHTTHNPKRKQASEHYKDHSSTQTPTPAWTVL